MKTSTFAPLRLSLATVLICFFLLAAVFCPAKEPPIEIAADKMTAVDKTQSVIFSGNVDAKQGDVRIRSDKMTIFYMEDTAKKASAGNKKNAQQVKKIVCEGDVEVTSKEWLGTSETMHYFAKENLVQLLGNAKAYQGQNMVQGERIDYHLDSGKSEVFGGTTTIGETNQKSDKPGRVNMTILEQ